MELFDFQKAWANTAVEYFKSSNLKVPRFNLFLDMGLGKTYISLDICKQLSVDSILVICPKSLVTMWEYEINNYFRCKPPKYTVINYEQFINNDTEYKPDILILDEPLNGLDKTGAEEFRNLFLTMRNEGKLILIATHNKEDIDML